MIPDLNLQFIREKIYETRNAIMYSMSNELVKIPNNIVTAVRVDNDGNLWFLSKRPMQQIGECEQSFPARLKFFRKGLGYFLEVSGKATIIGNDDQLTDSDGEKPYIQPVLLRLTITSAEYVEPEAKRPKTKVDILLERGYNWLLRSVPLHRHPKPLLTKLSSRYE